MILPEFTSADQVLEYAARLIEEVDFLDYRGIAAPRKRDREDAELRRQARLEMKAECARHIRAFKSRHDLDAVNVLRKLSQVNGRADLHLVDAWPLAWKGWLNIKCTIKCNSNSIPPETEYAIQLTDKGREVLASSNGPSPEVET